MKYGIIFTISMFVFVISAGSLADGNVDMTTIISVIVSLFGCVYSEYKLGWMKEYESK